MSKAALPPTPSNPITFAPLRPRHGTRGRFRFSRGEAVMAKPDLAEKVVAEAERKVESSHRGPGAMRGLSPWSLPSSPLTPHLPNRYLLDVAQMMAMSGEVIEASGASNSRSAALSPPEVLLKELNRFSCSSSSILSSGTLVPRVEQADTHSHLHHHEN
jgi:hypothetical protein